MGASPFGPYVELLDGKVRTWESDDLYTECFSIGTVSNANLFDDVDGVRPLIPTGTPPAPGVIISTEINTNNASSVATDQSEISSVIDDSSNTDDSSDSSSATENSANTEDSTNTVISSDTDDGTSTQDSSDAADDVEDTVLSSGGGGGFSILVLLLLVGIKANRVYARQSCKYRSCKYQFCK